MFKVFVWSAAISATGAAALFVPIDPTLLNGVGIAEGVAFSIKPWLATRLSSLRLLNGLKNVTD